MTLLTLRWDVVTFTLAGMALTILALWPLLRLLPSHLQLDPALAWLAVPAAVGEEALFRLLPMSFLGWPGLLLGTVVWALIHWPNGPRSGVLTTLFYAPVFYFLWTAGLGKEAIAVHAICNLIAISAYYLEYARFSDRRTRKAE